MATTHMLYSWKIQEATEEESWTGSFVESSTISSCTWKQHFWNSLLRQHAWESTKGETKWPKVIIGSNNENSFASD